VAKPRYRDIDGILLFDKAPGLSSNQALQKARHLFQANKAGHTGSLDPLATGLLPICFGEATKIAGYLLGSAKAYAAECRLGVTTTTCDAEGEPLETRPVAPYDDATVEAALSRLRGRIQQTAPVYSALKQGGVPLYKRARRGEHVQAPTREVEVMRLDLVARAPESLQLHVECGSGTYVRSLVRDLGETLGCGAHLTALRRLWVDPFRTVPMHTLADLEQRFAQGGLAALDRVLLPLETGIVALPQIVLSPEQVLALRQGRRIPAAGTASQACMAAVDAQGRLVALVEIDAEGAMRVLRGFNSDASTGTPDGK